MKTASLMDVPVILHTATSNDNYKCNCYLAAPRPTLGHSQGDSLTNPMLITVFLSISIGRSLGAS